MNSNSTRVRFSAYNMSAASEEVGRLISIALSFPVDREDRLRQGDREKESACGADRRAALAAQSMLVDALLSLLGGDRNRAAALFQIEALLVETLVMPRSRAQSARPVGTGVGASHCRKKDQNGSVAEPQPCSGPELCFRLLATMAVRLRESHRTSNITADAGSDSGAIKPYEVTTATVVGSSAQRSQEIENGLYIVMLRLLGMLLHLRPVAPAPAWGAGTGCLLLLLDADSCCSLTALTVGF